MTLPLRDVIQREKTEDKPLKGRAFRWEQPAPLVDTGHTVECTVCDDKGFVAHYVPVGHPDFGKAFPCSNPLCRVANENRQRQLQNLMASAGIKNEFLKYSFATWDAMPKELKQNKRTARLALQMYVNRKGEPFALSELYNLLPQGSEAQKQMFDLYRDDTELKSGIILTGTNGTGKTGLIASAALALLDAGVGVLFINTLEMLNAIMAGYGSELSESRRQTVKNASHLFMDELTFEANHQHRLELQETTRHRHDMGLPMVITTNMELGEFTDWFSPQVTKGLLGKCHWIEVGEPVLRHELNSVARSRAAY